MKYVLTALLFIFSGCTHEGTIVPVELQFGNPVATAVIGETDVRLIVDSGGYSLGLRPEVVAGLKFKDSAEQTRTTDIHGKTIVSTAFSVPSMEIGGRKFANLSAYEWTIPLQLADLSPRIDGTLGRDFLNKFVAIYDYGNSSVTLYDYEDRNFVGCSGAKVPLVQHSENVIVTKAIVDDGEVTAIWDTGATHSFVKARVAEEREFSLDLGKDTGDFYNSARFNIGESEFGPLDFVLVPFTEPQNVDVYIGRNFFAKHVVCINAVDRWLRVRAN